jgi:FixJ family two-component response regulator
MSLAQVMSYELESPHASIGEPLVFVVEKDDSDRESLKSSISCGGWKTEAFASGHEFLIRPWPALPSCLVLNDSLPDLTGLDLQMRVSVDRPHMSIIFITGEPDVYTTVRAMKAGAIEFLIKPFRDDILLGAIGEGIKRSYAELSRGAEVRTLRESYARLSQRERQVMDLVASGLLNKQVGAELGISEITVKAHRGQAMQKMKANSFADLVRMVARLRSERVLQNRISSDSHYHLQPPHVGMHDNLIPFSGGPSSAAEIKGRRSFCTNSRASS